MDLPGATVLLSYRARHVTYLERIDKRGSNSAVRFPTV
jgi:hypothetical protein